MLVTAYGQVGAPQCGPKFFRYSTVDISAVGLFDDPRAALPRSRRRHNKRLRGAKLVAALSLTVLVGLSSYAASYKTLVLISTSAPATGSVVPANSGDATTTTLPASAQLPS